MFVVFDLDGTLALDGHREHFLLQAEKDWDSYFEACDGDEPNVPIIETLKMMSQYVWVTIEIWTGRSETVREKTTEWLERQGIRHGQHYMSLRMRGVHDRRPDTEVKEDWLLECRGDGVEPSLVFDDRNSVVKWWRDRGITCCQVAEGNF